MNTPKRIAYPATIALLCLLTSAVQDTVGAAWGWALVGGMSLGFTLSMLWEE